MANELEIVKQGAGYTLYAVIRSCSNGYVWNGASLVAWQDLDIEDYSVALTDRGGDLYQGAFPATIPAGTYRITYYLQQGASPAITDLILSSVRAYWDTTSLSLEASVGEMLSTVAKLETALEADGAVYRFTTNALEQAPSGTVEGALDWTTEEKEQIRQRLGLDGDQTVPTGAWALLTYLATISAKLNGTVIRTVNSSIISINLTRGETKTLEVAVPGIDVTATEVRVAIAKQGDPPTKVLELSSSTGAVVISAYPVITFALTQVQSDALPAETLMVDIWVKADGKWYSVDVPVLMNVSQRIVGTLA